MGPRRNAAVKIRLTAPISIMQQKVLEKVVAVNSTWEEVLRGHVHSEILSRIKESHSISTSIDSRNLPHCVRIWTVGLSNTVGDFIAKFQRNRKVYCARLHQLRANTTSTGTRTRPNVRPTMSTRSRRLDAPPEIDFEGLPRHNLRLTRSTSSIQAQGPSTRSNFENPLDAIADNTQFGQISDDRASGYESEPSSESNGEFITSSPNTPRAGERIRNAIDIIQDDLIKKFEQNTNINLLLLRQELLDIQRNPKLRDSIILRWPGSLNYLEGMFLNVAGSGEADDTQAEENGQPGEIEVEIWPDGTITPKTPYADRTKELNGIPNKNIKTELLEKFRNKTIENLLRVRDEYRVTESKTYSMEKMEEKWPRSLLHLKDLFGKREPVQD